MAIDPDEKTEWNNNGQKDAADNRWPHEPWSGFLESSEHYDERRDAYNSGYINGLKQKNK